MGLVREEDGSSADTPNAKKMKQLSPRTVVEGPSSPRPPTPPPATTTTAAVTPPARVYDFASPEVQRSCRQCRQGVGARACGRLHPGDDGFIDQRCVRCPRGEGKCAPARLGKCPYYHDAAFAGEEARHDCGSKEEIMVTAGAAGVTPTDDDRSRTIGSLSDALETLYRSFEAKALAPVARKPSPQAEKGISSAPACRWGWRCPYKVAGGCAYQHDV